MSKTDRLSAQPTPTRPRLPLRALLVAGLALLGWAGVALPAGAAGAPAATAAQDEPPLLRRSLVAVPYNDAQGVTLQLSPSRTSVTIGETLGVCFQASASGFVSLWDISPDGSVSRIFPNPFSGDQGARRVEGGNRRCVGIEGDPFRLQVGGPPGTDDLYLLWSVEPAAQPTVAGYPNPQSFAADLQRLRQQHSDRWATLKTSFDIVGPAAEAAPAAGAAATPAAPSRVGRRPPDEAPSAPNAAATPAAARPAASRPAASRPADDEDDNPVPAPAAVAPEQGKILILAMGANVTPLTKSNQDAETFVGAIRSHFRVDREQVRLLRNVYRPQFKQGMEWLRTTARPQDLVFVYYSGHGAQVPDLTGSSPDGQESAFVPYEFNNERLAQPGDFIRNNEFVQWLNAIPSDNIITVVDACHSGGFYRSLGQTILGAKTKFYVPPVALLGAPPPTPAQTQAALSRSLGALEALEKARPRGKGLLLAAARYNQYALELDEGSLFTLALVRAIRGARSGSLHDLFAKVVREVEQESERKQTPVEVGERAVADRLRFAR